MLEAPQVEGAVAQRLLHRAARLAFVPAVPEPAVRGPFGHFRKHRVQTGPGGPGLEFAQAGRIHQASLRRNPEKLAPRRGVPAACIGLPHGLRRLDPLPQQRVDQRGFPDARRSQQDTRPAAGQP